MKSRVAGAAWLLAALALTACAAPAEEATQAAAGAGAASPAAAETTAEAEIAGLIRAAHLPPCPATAADAAPRAAGLPRLTLPCLGAGPDVTLSGLRGSPHLINVWASWCPPCGQEMPYLVAAHKELARDVTFLGINLVDRRSAALAWAKDFGMTFPSVQDPDGLIRSRLRVTAPPVTLFVRPDGSIAKIHYGAFTSGQDVRDAIAERLGVRR